MSSSMMDEDDELFVREELESAYFTAINVTLDKGERTKLAARFLDEYGTKVGMLEAGDDAEFTKMVKTVQNVAAGKFPVFKPPPEQKVYTPVVPSAATTAPRTTTETPPIGNINNLPCKPHDEAALTFDDLAGMQNEKDEMTKSIVLPLMFDFIPARSGILMFGPPGTGKTLIARALLGETNRKLGREWKANGPNQVNLFVPSAADLKSKYVGEGEAKIQQLWRCANDYARQAKVKLGVDSAKSIVFVDEIDSIAPRRQDDSNEATKATVAQLLQILQGAVPIENVFTIGATNRPWDVDPALERRLGAGKLFVDLPNSDARRSLLDMSFRKYKFRVVEGDPNYKTLLEVLTFLTGPGLGAKEAVRNEARILSYWARNKREPQAPRRFGPPFDSNKEINPLSVFGFSGSDITRLVETLAADSAWNFVNKKYSYTEGGQSKDCYFTVEAYKSGDGKYPTTTNFVKCNADVIKSVQLPLPQTLDAIEYAAQRAPSSINDSDYIRLLEYVWKIKLAPVPQ